MTRAARSLLFDLDGTLLDTAPDLANALNAVLAANGRSSLPYEAIREVVSHGGRALVELGFREPPDTPEFERLRGELLAYYADHICDQTRLFPGMEILLQTLDARGIPWGIVTNKPGWLTDPLLQKMDLLHRAAVVVSGDTLAKRKPDPAPLLHACLSMGVEPVECLYVGDAKRDIEAGNNAGMTTLVALFGYLADGDEPQKWNADGLVSHPQEILRWTADLGCAATGRI